MSSVPLCVGGDKGPAGNCGSMLDCPMNATRLHSPAQPYAFHPTLYCCLNPTLQS